MHFYTDSFFAASDVTVIRTDGILKFFSQMTDKEKKECADSHFLCYNKVRDFIDFNIYDLDVLDEVTCPICLGLHAKRISSLIKTIH